jgi:hypothetical protein
MFYLWFDRQLAGKLGCTATDPAEILLFLQKTNVIGRRVNTLLLNITFHLTLKVKRIRLRI